MGRDRPLFFKIRIRNLFIVTDVVRRCLPVRKRWTHTLNWVIRMKLLLTCCSGVRYSNERQSTADVQLVFIDGIWFFMFLWSFGHFVPEFIWNKCSVDLLCRIEFHFSTALKLTTHKWRYKFQKFKTSYSVRVWHCMEPFNDCFDHYRCDRFESMVHQASNGRVVDRLIGDVTNTANGKLRTTKCRRWTMYQTSAHKKAHQCV